MTAPLSIQAKLDAIKDRISDPSFLANKGLSNEVGIHVFCYDPKDELIVRDGISLLKNPKSPVPFNIIEINVFQTVLNLLDKPKIIENILSIETQRGSEALIDSLQIPCSAKLLLPLMKHDYVRNRDVVFLTGIGSAHPIVRAHSLLDGLQDLYPDIPIVMFYPGTYNNQTLTLFNQLSGDNYYRAFNLI
jgi:hypothetical protein